MKTLEGKLDALAPGRRKRIEERAALLIAQEMTMRELRKARRMTQTEMARALGIKQEQISRIEQRTDLHISTLRRSVEAMGGRLSLVAEFPDGAPVVVSGFAAMKP